MKLYQGDCLEVMKSIPDNSVDCIITDPPYGVTQNKKDTMLPFGEMWEQVNRIIKNTGNVLIFGQEIFLKWLFIIKNILDILLFGIKY